MTGTRRVNRLKEYRQELVRPIVSQEYIARMAGITMKTYHSAEVDRSIRYNTALAILKAVNTLRRQHGLSEIGIENLGLNYQ